MGKCTFSRCSDDKCCDLRKRYISQTKKKKVKSTVSHLHVFEVRCTALKIFIVRPLLFLLCISLNAVRV